MKYWWKFVHNAVCHGLLMCWPWSEPTWVTKFHDWTADKMELYNYTSITHAGKAVALRSTGNITHIGPKIDVEAPMTSRWPFDGPQVNPDPKYPRPPSPKSPPKDKWSPRWPGHK